METVEDANIASVVVTVRRLGSANLKSSAAVLYGFRLNKNARGQSSPELNSQNGRLWNWADLAFRKAYQIQRSY